MRLRPPCWLVALAACCLNATSALAQGNFVYTNDNANGSNTVTGFSVDSSGVLTRIPGSPFLTGGDGSGDGFFAGSPSRATFCSHPTRARSTSACSPLTPAPEI